MTTLIDCVREIGIMGTWYATSSQKITFSFKEITRSFSFKDEKDNLEGLIKPEAALFGKSEIKEAIDSVAEPIKKVVKGTVDFAKKFKDNTVTSVKSAFKNLYESFTGYAKSKYGAAKEKVRSLFKSGQRYNVDGSRVKGNEGKFAQTPGSPAELRERYLELTCKIPQKCIDVETYQRLELKKAHLGGPF